jgi:hypothetical protein
MSVIAICIRNIPVYIRIIVANMSVVVVCIRNIPVYIRIVAANMSVIVVNYRNIVRNMTNMYGELRVMDDRISLIVVRNSVIRVISSNVSEGYRSHIGVTFP